MAAKGRTPLSWNLYSAYWLLSFASGFGKASISDPDGGVRPDDPGTKRALAWMLDMIKSGDMAKTWDKWFVQPIPPKNTRVGLPVSESTKAAWANPNDKPMEDYAKK